MKKVVITSELTIQERTDKIYGKEISTTTFNTHEWKDENKEQPLFDILVQLHKPMNPNDFKVGSKIKVTIEEIE